MKMIQIRGDQVMLVTKTTRRPIQEVAGDHLEQQTQGLPLMVQRAVALQGAFAIILMEPYHAVTYRTTYW